MGKNGRTLIIGFIFALAAAPAFADQPSLRDVVVLFDPASGGFRSEFYQSSVMEFKQLKMHSSCPVVRVQKFRTIQCVIGSKIIELGTIGSKNGVDGSLTGYSIKWSRKVELGRAFEPTVGDTHTLQVY